MLISIVLAYLALLHFLPVAAKKHTDPKRPPKDAILLSSVRSLTFRTNRQTTSRRSPPVPQLSCIGPPEICALYTPPVIRCHNEGSSYGKEDVEWACKADLPEEFKFGSTDVVCEGYESADDEFVLRGSCAVEYGLLLTDRGESRFADQIQFQSGYRRDGTRRAGRDDTPSAVGKVVFLAIFGAVVFLIVRSFVQSWRRNPPRLGNGNGRPPWYGGGGGGGAGDGDDDPPPPYDNDPSNPPRKPRTDTRSGTAGSSRSNTNAAANQGWRPGAWTAAAAGAAAGYVLSNRGNSARRRQEAQQRPYGGLFGGGGGGGTGGSSGWNSGPSSSSSSPPSFSNSSRHESTGFGSTRRR